VESIEPLLKMGNRVFLLKGSVSLSFAERFESTGFFFAPEFGKWVSRQE
jgi:hypothetical protein